MTLKGIIVRKEMEIMFEVMEKRKEGKEMWNADERK